MKAWSKNWIRSKNPRKQRKYIQDIPLHLVRKLMSVRLTKDLKAKYGKRNVPIRKGDTIKVVVGEHRGKVSKVTRISLRRREVYVDGVFIAKGDGTKLPKPLKSCNLMIMELDLDDKRRKELLERK